MFKVILGGTMYTYKLFYDYEGQDRSKKLVNTRAVLSQGEGLPEMDAVATCHTCDTPSKLFGRTLATARLAQAYLHPKEEEELWQQLQMHKVKFDPRILKSRCL